MPPKSAAPKPAPQSGINAFLQRLDGSIAEMQRFLSEYPEYGAQFTEHERAATQHSNLEQELAQKCTRVQQLEAAVAAFEGVHMNSAKALREENERLAQRLASAEEDFMGAQRAVEAARGELAEQAERLERERRTELERVARDQVVAMEMEKSRFEKHHTDMVDKSNEHLAKVKAEVGRQAMEIEKLELMNDGLKDRASKLKELQHEFANIPDEDFKQKLKDLSKRFHGFCKTWFMGVPEGSTPEQLAVYQQDLKENLKRSGFTDKVPFFTPGGNIEASRLLYLAGVEHIISESLCSNIFRPVTMHSCSDSRIFETISSRLHLENPWKEATWRISTVSALAGQTDLPSKLAHMAAAVLDLTRPLLHPSASHATVQAELAALFRRASDTWEPAQQSLCRIFATTTLPPDSGALSHTEQDTFCGADEDEADLADVDPARTVLCLFPRVFRERAFSFDRGVDTEDSGCVYYPGAALYADAGAYVVAQKEHREVNMLMAELARKAQAAATLPGRVSRRSRRLCMTVPLQTQPQGQGQGFAARLKKSLAAEGEKKKEKEKEEKEKKEKEKEEKEKKEKEQEKGKGKGKEKKKEKVVPDAAPGPETTKK